MAYNRNDDKLKSLSVKALIENKVLFSKVLNLMEQQKSYNYILQFLETQGYKMAKGSLTNLKHKIEEAHDLGKPIESIADKREKNSIDDVPDNKIIGFTGKSKEPVEQDVVDDVQPITVYSENQVLEAIISKGMKSIQQMEFVDPKTLLSALGLYARYYGSKTRGLTSEALKQYQMINQSILSAYREVFVRYVPKDKQEEAINELDKQSKAILQNIGATPQGKELLKQLHKADLNLN